MGGQDPLSSAARLASLAATGLMDSPPEAAFDRLTRLASLVLGVPIAAMTLLDARRQFFKSAVGLVEPYLSARESRVEDSFCQHAVRSREVFVVEDARSHPLVKDSCFVADGVVSYAGVPIISGGQALGALCVADDQPRSWAPRELEILRDLTAAVVDQIDAHVAKVESEHRRVLLETVIDTMGSGVVVAEPGGRITVFNGEARRLTGDTAPDGPIAQRPARIGVYHPDGGRLFAPEELPLGRALRGESVDEVEMEVRPPHQPDVEHQVLANARPLPTGGAVMILRDITGTKALEARAKQNEELYRTLAANMPNAIVVLVDTDLKILLAEGSRYFRTTGKQRSDFEDHYLKDVVPAERYAESEAPFRRALAGEDVRLVRVIEGRSYETHISPIKDGSFITGAISLSFDVTERAAEEEALRTLGARLTALLERMHDAVIFEDETKHIQVANQAAATMWGRPDAKALVGLDVSSPTTRPDAHLFFPDPVGMGLRLHELRATRKPVTGERVELVGGRVFERDFLPLADGAVHRGNLWIYRDVTEREKVAAKLAELSIRDELTGLLNRRGFLTRGQKVLESAIDIGSAPILFFIDLNGMKPINDRLGHEEGDRALVDTANLLREAFGPEDLVARLGGDEFVVLVADPQGRAPASYERELRDAVSRFNDKCLRLYRVSVSIGATCFEPDAPRTLEQLLVAADAQMYSAKRARQERGGVSLPPPGSTRKG